jgi:two-component system cell cycle sensor histidine kinase/response regulator CckA
MYKYRSLIFSFLVFIIVISTGVCCIKHFISGYGEQMALRWIAMDHAHTLTDHLSDLSSPLVTPASFGFIGLSALALSILTYFCLVKSRKLEMHSKELTESNQRLGDEIIQRKAAEEKSANIAREWARTFDSIPDLISIHRNDFRIIRANQALADFLGASKEEITGKLCYEVFHCTKEPIAECPHVRTMESKKPVTVELLDLKAVCHSMVSTSPIFNKQHEVIGIVHIVKDTTEMKKLEERLSHAKHMEAVGRLAGGVAHEFNNILAAIINYGYLLRDASSGNLEFRNFIDKILALAEKASQTSQNLLIYSRKQYLALKPSDLNMILKNTGQLICNFKGKDIEFVSLPSDGALMIMANEQSIEQCIINLAGNAVEVMSNGGTLTIMTGVVAIDTSFMQSHGFGTPGLYALLSVTDTGPGMNNKTSRKIFEPFFTTKEVGKGTGLGLSMVYGITKQHNGYIDVKSQPGNGSTFRLYFPLINKDTLLSKTKEAFGNE